MTSDVEGLVQAARAHDARALGKLLSMVEDDDPALPALMSALLGAGVQAPYVIGLTGAPGVGKSTTTSALIALWREREQRVGVGQAEVDIARTADTTGVLLAPGMGDGIQAAKAGLLEVADLLVVNKCDRDGADAAVRELHNMIATGGEREPGEWRPVVVRATATAAGGIDELVEAIDKHRAWLVSSGDGERRRVRRA